MTFKSLLKTLLAVAIIGAGAAIGWVWATNTNPYAPGANPTAGSASVQAVAPNTPLPTFTPPGAAITTPAAATARGEAAAGSPTTAGSSATAAATTTTGAVRGQTGGQAVRGGRAVAGTIESYDAAAKVMTIKSSDGSSQKFTTGSARVTRSEKVSPDEFNRLAAAGITLVNGEKGPDSVIAARSLTAVDIAGAGGPATGVFGGGGPGSGGSNVTGGPGGAGLNFGGAVGVNTPVIVRGGKLESGKFSGPAIGGDTVTASVSDTTALLKQASGGPDDLKPGLNVSVTARPAQGDAPSEAVAITIN